RDLAASKNLKIDVLELDVLSDEQVQGTCAQALEMSGGKIDVLINNAGIGITGPVEVQDMTATDLAFDTNVYGPHRMVRALLPSMRARRDGLIIPISSQLGRLVVPGAGHYSATKFALEAMNEQLAYELVPHGIDVSIIQPGGYPTKIWVNRNRYTGNLKDRTTEDVLSAYADMTARMGQEDGSGRTADPLDIPRAIAEIIAMPKGKRPLRRAVHPTFRPQEGVNAAMVEAQLQFLGRTPYGPLVKDVLERD
ncbi:MAG: SDR family NAD(P)-dependent oxidoreductase, partial [Pseudomonadota bacterium]